ncbi:BTB/POZ and MATH domain-containing protein 1 [Dichanthelium oligosanthes]|uniref:BTB/POZ and MATH domain-containing protein 1 n=1 Tax=Dichanthelium oligosanthes TaxID=888268 RepID=A0A1E5UZ32_9POAL|nr:BTB/POZ and MATH domain-containing protein 1 [Dichanthelium oligosanthes]
MTRLEGQTIDSAFHEFRVDYEQTKHLGIGKAIYSDAFSAGSYMWRVHYYPHGHRDSVHKVRQSYVSIYIELVSKSRPVNAICEAFIMDKDGQPCPYAAARTDVVSFRDLGDSDKCGGGWPQFVLRTDLEEYYLTGWHITFVCAIMVVHDRYIPVPPSNIKKHFSNLLGSTDVSFTIDGETFNAHRTVLAARSPVLKELMSSITLHDIAPATFRVMLQFMYNDALPEDDELGDSPEMMQQLLAAADRYGLDQLKLMCAQKLGDNVSVDTVAATLTCAEMYSCPELKNKCIDFFVMDGNCKKAMLTKGFVQLGQKFPSIIDELRERVGL